MQRHAVHILQGFPDAFAVGRMGHDAAEHVGYGQVVDDGGCELTDHVCGAGAHHLGAENLLSACFRHDFDKAALFFGDEALAVGAHDELAADHIDALVFGLGFCHADDSDFRIRIDAGRNDCDILRGRCAADRFDRADPVG